MSAPLHNGQAIPVFTVEPDWSDGVSLRPLFSTRVFEALDTSEQRLGTRPRPLYGVRFTTLELSGQEAGYIRRVLELADDRPVAMPVWSEETRLQSAVSIGATSLAVEDLTISLWHVLPEYALLWRAFNDWEILAIEEIGDSTITLTDPTTVAWTAGTLVVPLLFGKLPRGAKKHLTDEQARFQVDFEERFNGIIDQSIVEQPLALPVTYPTACRDSFEFTCVPPSGETYTLQIADTALGPWAAHLFIVGDGTEKTRRLNNDYDGDAYFRLISSTGAVINGAVRPRASVIAAPSVEISNVTNVEGARPMHGASGFTYAVSELENPLINPESFYVVPRGRFEWSSGDTTSYLATPTVLTITGASGATHVFTRDGTDPEEDTPMPVRGGSALNCAAALDDFRCVVKVRSFKDGCRSPMTCILVDRSVWQTPLVSPTGRFQAVSDSCDEPRVDNIREDWTRDESGEFVAGLVAHTFESGDSCSEYPGGLLQYLIDLSRDLVVGGAGLAGYIFRRTGNTISGGVIADYGTGDAGQHRSGFLWNSAGVSVFTIDDFALFRSAGRWNYVPELFSNALLTLNDGSSETEYYLTTNVSICGPGGSESGIENVCLTQSQSVAEPLFNGASLKSVIFDLSIILTAHNDYEAFTVPGYTPPDPLDPPEAYSPIVDGDNFETYADDSDIDADTLADGDGFGGAWSFLTDVQEEGFDSFDGYTDAEIEDGDATYVRGEGWDGAWSFSAGVAETFGDSFDTYADTPNPVGFNDGTGFDDPWEIVEPYLLGGGDSFDAYADDSDIDGDTLEYGTGWQNAWSFLTD